MTVTEIRALIPQTISRFKERIPQAGEWIDDLSIKVATHRTAEKLFYETISELDARPKPFLPDTVAEAFTGQKGYAVIVYQHRIQAAAHALA